MKIFISTVLLALFSSSHALPAVQNEEKRQLPSGVTLPFTLPSGHTIPFPSPTGSIPFVFPGQGGGGGGGAQPSGFPPLPSPPGGGSGGGLPSGIPSIPTTGNPADPPGPTNPPNPPPPPKPTPRHLHRRAAYKLDIAPPDFAAPTDVSEFETEAAEFAAEFGLPDVIPDIPQITAPPVPR